ncbi:MAG: hypothetical protein IJM36_04485 [Acholeplasmatales bacterium]|nr:hypothetical protein [Acholeplasmatales bacterium]
MANAVDITLKKILKIARALSAVRTLAYLIGGILILVLNERIEEYIYLVVGIDLILVASLELMKEIVDRGYKEAHNHIGTAIFTIIVGVLILTIFHDNVYKVSVMWAVATVVTSTMEINEGLHEIHERKAFSILNLVFAVAEIVFSILLLIEPEENAEHFLTHIYLLGVGFIIEAAEALITVFSPFLQRVPVVNVLPGMKKIADEREEEIKEEQERIKVEKELRELKKIEKERKQLENKE